tara:strand:+ start:816 stop:2717 length:1902 start_codon:yes stop_codon:yes gene_type:complete
MCGIAGIISKNNHNILIKNMVEAISHRGPDNLNYWFDSNKSIYFGHARLSIQDLSALGNQPMFSSTKNHVIIFNGEIYNALFLKNRYLQTKNINLKGSSDTEILINLIEIYGIDFTLNKIKGMFAFAVFNIKNNKLYLSRDRIGEKPLYYLITNNELFFSSEIKSILQNKNIKKEINDKCLNQYLKYGFISSSESIFKNIKKIPAGSYIEFNDFNNLNDNNIIPYWSIFDYVDESHKKENFNYNNIVEKFDNLFSNSIESQLVSDAPLGVFLSSGIDSSLITCKASKFKKLDTFTLGFEEDNYNESKLAKDFSNYLGLKNRVKFLSKKDIYEYIDFSGQIFDEPFGDISQLPTYCLSKFASNYVKVCLSGDGGDELSLGYNRHIYTKKFYSNIFLRLFFKYFNIANSQSFMKLISLVFSSDKSIMQNFEIKINKLSLLFNEHNFENAYKSLYQKNMKNFNFFYTKDNSDFFSDIYSDLSAFNNQETKMYLIDILSYLPDNILVKSDMASMSNSLELRTPYLDKDLIEFMSSVSFQNKNKNSNKSIYRDVLKKSLPSEMISKGKMGFGIPIENWTRSFLKNRIDDAIDYSIKKFSFVDNKNIKKIWKLHLENKINVGTQFWNLIILTNWHRNYF